MKYITLVILFFTSAVYGKTISQDGVDYACSPKATCEEKLRASKKEIATLKTKLATKSVVQERLVYKDRVVVKEKTTYKKNRLGLMLGHGATGGLKHSTSPGNTSVESEKDFTLGAQYQRLVTERVSLGLGGFTNGLVFVGAGYDF